MGQSKCIGSIDWEKQLAHSRLSAAFFGSNNGPIQVYQQHCLGETVGPFKGIGSICLAVIMGPCEGIGSIDWEKQ